MSSRPTPALADDDRGRIPFAVIGVLLLVSSVTLVGALESRPDPEPNVDPSLAMDRTTAASQTALRDAVVRAADRAASRPVTQPTNNPYGATLGDPDDPDAVFENYLEGLVYLEAEESLPAAGQEIRDTETTASLRSVETPDEFAAAIEQVSIDRPEDGLLTVTIEDVTISVADAGGEIAARNEDVTVTVATPLFQLRERVGEYEAALNRSALDGDGLGRQFSGRLYAMAWTRGYAQYAGQPIAEVIANRHVEVAANSAVFSTQRSVFGTQDPYGSNAMRQAWLCLAAKDADELYGGYGGGESQRVDSDDVCNTLEYLYGDRSGGLPPEPPSVQDLLAEAPGMDETVTIGVNESAYLPIRHMVDEDHEDSFGSVIDRVFDVEAESDRRVAVEYDRPEPTAPATAPPNGSWAHVADRPVEYVDTDVVDADRTELAGERYYRYEVTIRNAYEQEAIWEGDAGNSTVRNTTIDEGEAEITVTVVIGEHDHSLEAKVDDVNAGDIDRKYEIGAGGGDIASVNYAEAPEKAEAALIGDDGLADLRATVVDAAEDELPHALEDELSLADRTTLDLDHDVGVAGIDVPSLEAAIAQDLTRIQRDVEDVSVEFERADLVQEPDEDGPFDDLIASIEEHKAAYVERERAYDNVAQKATYEARLAYFELLIADLRRVADAHHGAMEGIDDELEGANSGLGDTTEFMQEAMAAEKPDSGSVPSPDLVDDVTYEVSGSPTYLTIEPKTREHVPPIEEGEEHAPMAARNRNYFSVPYDEVVSGILDRIPLLDLGEDQEEVQLQTAGELLRAAEKAEEVGVTIGEKGSIQENVEEGLVRLEENITGQIYDGLDVAESPVGDAVSETLGEEWDSTSERAIAAGNGSMTDVVTESVVDALEPHHPNDYEPAVWRAEVRAVTRSIVIDSIAHETVQFTQSVDAVDERIRSGLEERAQEVVDERLESDEFTLDDEQSNWLNGTDSAKRVPAGLPITPVPGYWYATANAWDVDVSGEYARFEVKSSMGSPATGSGTTYVREDATATVEIGGNDHALGSTESLSFHSRSVVVVVVPPGGIGVGDRTGVRTECSEVYPVTGSTDGADVDGCAGDSN